MGDVMALHWVALAVFALGMATVYALAWWWLRKEGGRDG